MKVNVKEEMCGKLIQKFIDVCCNTCVFIVQESIRPTPNKFTYAYWHMKAFLEPLCVSDFDYYLCDNVHIQ
jgi:hypothetical protein